MLHQIAKASGKSIATQMYMSEAEAAYLARAMFPVPEQKCSTAHLQEGGPRTSTCMELSFMSLET